MAVMGWLPLCPVPGVRGPHQGCRGTRPGGGIQRGCGAQTPSALSLGATVGNIPWISSVSLDFTVSESCAQLQPQRSVTHGTHSPAGVLPHTGKKEFLF